MATTPRLRLDDVLTDSGHIVTPLHADTLEEAIETGLGRMVSLHLVPPGAAEGKLAHALASGDQGWVTRVDDDIVVVSGRASGIDRPTAVLAVGSDRFEVSGEGTRPSGSARSLLLVLAPPEDGPWDERRVGGLVRGLKVPGRSQRLLDAATAEEIWESARRMDEETPERLLVEDVLTPQRYRVYPDTPIEEVVDLMLRRRLRVVPVVGEHFEVLGIITSGDALRVLLPRAGEAKEAEGDEPAHVARDVMTRSVMCVSEEQSLFEAANVMVNRDVDQIPVVREGEFVGFITRDVVLRRLFGSSDEERGD